MCLCVRVCVCVCVCVRECVRVCVCVCVCVSPAQILNTFKFTVCCFKEGQLTAGVCVCVCVSGGGGGGLFFADLVVLNRWTSVSYQPA